ncbi:MAG TPA: SRPBCC family protein [Polyangiaceae bacterium]|nr:SRPBCC family protein [Polyangiaceae bacterium]
MLKKILIGLGAAIALLVIVILLQPAKFRIERSITMAAPPDAAFAQVNDFHAWVKWSPWEKLDPNLKRSYEGPSSGAGAKYAWVGNEDVGEGRMTIEKSNAPSEIQIKLEFFKPFEAKNTTIFTFAKTAEGNKTTWAMEGENNFAGKAMSLFMNMEKMVGPDFEKGLASMKNEAEAAAKASPSAANVSP